MKKIFILSFFIFSFPFLSFSQKSVLPVEINGDEVSYLHLEEKVVVKGNVRMKYKDMELFCDNAEYDVHSNIAKVMGNVKIVREDTTIYGNNIIYDFNTQNAEMVEIKVESSPLYGRADEAEKEGKDKYILKNGYITTCDLEKPHYRLIAKKIIVYPKIKVVAKNVFLKVDGVPIFYFPYYVHSLKDTSFPLQVIPGKNSDWGKYVLGRWRYNLGDYNHGKIIFDWYERRGLGSGIIHKIESEKFGEALFNYYRLEDKLYDLEKRDELFDRYSYRKDETKFEDDRYKAQFFYSASPFPKLSIKSEFNKFSDIYFMRDFFYREYEIEQHPLSYTLFDYSLDNASISLLAQKRVNHFFTETEYLPQLECNFYQQPLGNSNIYLKSDTKFGHLSYKVANSSLDYSSIRAYSYNVLSYPKNIKWLYINPYVGNYATFYTEGLLEDTTDIFRTALESGIDFSTKLYKIFDIDFKLFGREVKKIRHLITPIVRYHYISPPTSKQAHIVSFDDFDKFDRVHNINFEFRNKWQAKNNEKVWDFIYFSPSVFYNIDKENKGGHLESITSELEFYPQDGFSITSETKYSFVNDDLDEANLDIGFYDYKNKKYSASLGYRYVRSYDYGDGTIDYSSQTTSSFTYQLTPKLQFKNYLRYEYKYNRFQEQQYFFRLDLHCWWMDFGVNINRERDVDNFTFWVIFRLKAFPDIHVGFDHSYHGARESY